MAQDDQRQRGVAGKVIAILEAFAPGDIRLSLSEICRRADVPLSTGHRLVSELTGHEFLERLPDRTYRIGLRLWRIGSQAATASGLRELALPYMENLYEATHENVQLAVRRGSRALYLERLRGPRSLPIVTRVAAELPLHSTGVGKVLLAYAPDDVVREVIASGLPAYTAKTVTEPERLRAGLAEIRRTGVCVTQDEMTMGARSIAAPVRDGSNAVVAALSLVTRRGADWRPLVPLVMGAARDLSRDVARHWRAATNSD
jgi:DNA-binding IclR family transcriptional regulator